MLKALLRDAFAEHADKVAIVRANGTILTYASLFERVASFARSLPQHREGSGAAIAVHVLDPLYYLLVCLAAIEAECVFVPIDPRMRNEDAEALALRVGARILVRRDGDGDLELKNLGSNRVFDPRVGVLLFTSGSSGASKTVVLGKDGVVANVQAILSYLPIHAGSRSAIVLPLSYSYALIGQVFTTFAKGGAALLLQSLRYPIEQLEAMRALGANGLSSVPASFGLFCDLFEEGVSKPNLEYLACAGAPLRQSLRTALAKHFPDTVIFNQYGLTEASPRVSACSSDEPAFHRGSVGKPLANVDISILRADGTKAEPGESGAVHVRGPNVMLEYLDDPSSTHSTLTPHGLRTHDVGYLDQDGFLFITGRADDIVNVAGERVSTEEVRTTLARLDGISEVEIVALEDERLGIALGAVVVLHEGADLPAIRAKARTLHPAKRPSRWIAVREIPIGQRGKVDRAALRALFERST